MGYLTQNLIGHSPVFLSKVELALTSLVESALGGANDAMAKVVMHDIPRYAKDLGVLLALAGLDLDSTDLEIDAGITSNIPWLLAKTQK